MNHQKILLTVLAFLVFAASYAQAPKTGAKPHEDTDQSAYLNTKTSVTDGTVTIDGKKIDYRAATGLLILKNEDDKPTIAMSYTAYLKKGEADIAHRPITFVYNGGPGSSSSWLHMAAFGPKIFDIVDLEQSTAPFKIVNNSNSLLDVSDLVFIDAPGTGFGKIITKEMGGAGKREDFFGTDQDGKAFADFIYKYITVNNRWNSPKYLFGESYGTLRSPVVALNLSGMGVRLNGIIQLSQLLNYVNASRAIPENPGADLNFQLMLPTYAATAYYHGKTAHQQKDIATFLKEVEDFTANAYASALSKGLLLDEHTKKETAEKLHGYIGLPIDYILKADLRIKQPQFTQNLLADENKITGRLDTRYVGDAINPLSENAQYDPMGTHVGAALSAALNTYMREELQFGEELFYKTSGNVRPWKYTRRGEFGFPNVMGDLSRTMILNPTMKVMLNSGYFDLSTPYYQGKYEMSHLQIPKYLYENIEFHYYEAGHMMYLQPKSFKLLHDNVAEFIRNSY